VIANNDDGVLLAMNGPSPMKGRSMMASPATIVALAALATPQIFKALKRAELAENLNNSRQVKLALDGWAIDEEGAYPENLAALVRDGDFIGELKVKCEDGEMRDWIYVPGLKLDSDPELVILYGPEPSDGKRIVVRVDGSARALREEDFQELARAQKLGLE
jgi:hypothetical protein